MKTFNDTYMFYSNMDTVIRMPDLMESGRNDFEGVRIEESGKGFMEVLRSLFTRH